MASKERDFKAAWSAAYGAAFAMAYKPGGGAATLVKAGEDAANVADQAVSALGLVETAARIKDLERQG